MCPKASQLRTGRSQKNEKVSEGESASDRAKPKERECVRRRVSFGQGKAKRMRLSPKVVQHRTEQSQKNENVPEGESASDRSKPKERECVRRRVSFGQGEAKRMRMCPKVVQHRTEQSQKNENVSEGESALDRAKPKERVCVRRRVNFGQGKAKRMRSCPKASSFCCNKNVVKR